MYFIFLWFVSALCLWQGHGQLDKISTALSLYMWSFIINRHSCIMYSSNDFESLKMLCLYIATIIVCVTLLNRKYEKLPIHVQLPIHDENITEKRLYWNCLACKLSCVLSMFRSITNIDTVSWLQCHRSLVQFLALTGILMCTFLFGCFILPVLVT